MAPGNRYDIGVFIRDANGNQLSAEQVRQLVANGRLKVWDSRTGSIVKLEQLPTGHFRVTGKSEGITYIVYEMGGTHASVRIDVKKVLDREAVWYATLHISQNRHRITGNILSGGHGVVNRVENITHAFSICPLESG